MLGHMPLRLGARKPNEVTRRNQPNRTQGQGRRWERAAATDLAAAVHHRGISRVRAEPLIAVALNAGV